MAANPTHLTSKTKAPKKTISFRIEPEILDKLGDASSQDEITLNTLVNHVLGDYLSWDRPALKSGWIQIKKEVAKSMMDRLGCSTNIDYTDKTLVIKIKKPFKILLK